MAPIAEHGQRIWPPEAHLPQLDWTPATNLDNNGNIINDPRTADRGMYTVFCGCFCVNKSKVTITEIASSFVH